MCEDEVLSVELDADERLVAVKIRQAQVLDRLTTQTRALDALNLRHLKVSDFLSDLDWASSAKTPDAHIEALHWEHGAIAVEVRGSATPFPNDERVVRRSAQLLRPGVWLWGVASADVLGAGARNPRAEHGSAP